VTEAPRVAAAPANPPAAPALDIEIGGDLEIPAAETPGAPKAAPAARPFSFSPAQATSPRHPARTDRVPQKFRQLLEQAAAESRGR
jgi:hypothetical protein